MRRTIYFALLLVLSGTALPQTRVAPGPFGRSRVLVIGLHRFRGYPVVFSRCDVFSPVQYPVPYPVWNLVTPVPDYLFAGTISESHPRLVFNDGTTYTVTDYWRVDDQLHFITGEDGGTKSVPHVVPFSQLDVQRTTDADKALGFQFVIRNEPIDQWLEHHAQHR